MGIKHKDQFSDHRLCISALEHAMKVILNIYVLLALINTLCKYCYALV